MNNTNTNTNTNINIINDELNNSIESPIINNLQLVKIVPTEVKDSLTKVFKGLDTSSTSFVESIPHYGDKSKGIYHL